MAWCFSALFMAGCPGETLELKKYVPICREIWSILQSLKQDNNMQRKQFAVTMHVAPCPGNWMLKHRAILKGCLSSNGKFKSSPMLALQNSGFASASAEIVVNKIQQVKHPSPWMLRDSTRFNKIQQDLSYLSLECWKSWKTLKIRGNIKTT